MENKVLAILLGGLIVAIIFHALASRYELHEVRGTHISYRIDRLTGKVWICESDFARKIVCFVEKPKPRSLKERILEQ